ncbi:hypothetical protein H2200_010218 [Cladophialophora chaetospira]|uniref:Uncharacterized protein n=1 Tax=Cladophialophora chaetospira TaxID=386627 RepID=A0AA38X2E1_9EURO|nr:hypothetical protein H2200_010218 [Cladophialophora chaetospira]
MSASVGPLLNGIMPPPAPSINEALEYEKILRIRDEVFSGSHPRLTVPAHAIRVPASQTPSTFSQNQLHVPSPFSATASPHRLAAATQSNKREDESTPQNKPNGVPVSAASQPASSVSEFDPILLTKSDDLVRAETLLKRQRLEKALRDQFENKRADARKKPAPAEAKPDFDLPTIFARITGAAKSPSSKDEEEATDSVNEDEFYSSRAPDSTPEGPPSESPDEADVEQADQPSGPRVVSAVMGAPLYPDIDERMPAYVPPPAHTTDESNKSLLPADPTAMDIDDEEEEGEYSPPEGPVQVPSPKATHTQDMRDSRDPRGRPLRRYSEAEDNGGRPLQSEAHMRIVRNHITSPIAPRPSRVSPLAVAKDSPLLQNARTGRNQWIGRPGSPPSPDDNQGVPARKRRKLEAREARNQRKQAKRNGRMSPDVKEEDVSPPPFHDVQPLGSARLRPSGADRPIVIDDEPVQEVRYAPAPERYVESPTRPLPRQVERLMPSSEPRPLSRSSARPMRDDQDLRRVASMHSMRAEQPRDYADPYYESPTRARGVSYARVSSPALTESGRPLREAPVEYDQPPPEVRVVRTPAPMYREVYDERDGTYHRYIAEPMPPPPPIERIVVDQYGRRFREIIQDRPSVAPREMSVRREVEPVYDQYPRQARAGSVFVEAPPERAYAAEMPPPPVSYRRVAEPARGSALPSPTTREHLESAPPMRSASVQVMDRPIRQPMYADERPDFRDPPIRAGSVRPPPAIRYQDAQPMEMMPRGQSVRPIAHDGSVFVEDRRALVPEYAPVAEPRYRAMEPERRYVDADGREIMQFDETMDNRARISERY